MKIKLPLHIFKGFEKVLSEDIKLMLIKVVDKYGVKSGFTLADLIEEFLPENEVLINVVKTAKQTKKHTCEKNRQQNSNTNKKITKPKPKTKPNNRLVQCIARTWSEGKGLQCSRFTADDKIEYCRTHRNQIRSKGFLWQGTINDTDNKVAIIFNAKMERQNKRKQRKLDKEKQKKTKKQKT